MRRLRCGALALSLLVSVAACGGGTSSPSMDAAHSSGTGAGDGGILTRGTGGGGGVGPGGAGSGGVGSGGVGSGGVGSGGVTSSDAAASGGATLMADAGSDTGPSGDARPDATADSHDAPVPDGGADAKPDATGADATADAPAVDGSSADVSPDGIAPDAAPSTCPPVTTAAAGPHAAISAGYVGNLTDYSALYDVMCDSLKECVDTCVKAGGTTSACTAGSECIGSSGQGKHCLPPTFWWSGEAALEESLDDSESAQQTVVVIAYNDPLNVTDFRIALPDGATIRGIQFDVRRDAFDPEVVDDSIRVLRKGQPVGTDHRTADLWTTKLAYVTYGGPTDTWGTTWSPADFQSSGFGIAIANRAEHDGVLSRAEIDYVRARVTYVPATCK